MVNNETGEILQEEYETGGTAVIAESIETPLETLIKEMQVAR
ncbi:hypothetical protein [Paenibacillus apiarius]|nr:hypothetical protein [Paenibacillus apiarius]